MVEVVERGRNCSSAGQNQRGDRLCSFPLVVLAQVEQGPLPRVICCELRGVLRVDTFWSRAVVESGKQHVMGIWKVQVKLVGLSSPALSAV